MKALLYNFVTKKFVVKNKVVPRIQGNEALIQVKASAICGTDLHIMEGILKEKRYDDKEIILGHSFSGVIENVGGQVKKFKTCDRVFASNFVWCGRCRNCHSKKENLCDNRYVFGMEAPGSHAQYIKVPEKSLFHLPKNVNFDEGSLICDLLALVCHAARKVAPLPEQKIIIFGAGPIGVALGILLKIYGYKSVLITDPIEYRRQLASKFHLKTVNNKKFLEVENKFDVVFETSGSNSAFNQGFALLKRGGEMVLVGVPDKDFNLRAIKLISRELTLSGIFDYSSSDIKEALRLVKNKKIDLKKLVTHCFSLEEGEKAYRLLRNKKAGKIILLP